MHFQPNQPEEFTLELVRHQSRLRGFIRCMLFDARDVDDVLQDINVTLMTNAGKFHLGTDFWAWASTVARFQIRNHCRQLKNRNKFVFDDDLLKLIAIDIEKLGELVDLRRDALTLCLEKFPDPQRQLLQMRYGADSSLEKISKALDRPVRSIGQTLYRIRRGLLGCIERQIATGEKS